MASIIECIDLGGASNLMRVLISLTAALGELNIIQVCPIAHLSLSLRLGQPLTKEVGLFTAYIKLFNSPGFLIRGNSLAGT